MSPMTYLLETLSTLVRGLQEEFPNAHISIAALSHNIGHESPICLQLQGDFVQFFLDRGVEAGAWYGMDSEGGPQRNYLWTCPETGVQVSGIELASSLGKSADDCETANQFKRMTDREDGRIAS